MARFVFLNPGAPDFYADWERTAEEAVSVLHSAAGRDPHSCALSDLVGELSTGLTIIAYTPEPGSESEEALNLLASWAATPDHEQPTHAADEA